MPKKWSRGFGPSPDRVWEALARGRGGEVGRGKACGSVLCPSEREVRGMKIAVPEPRGESECRRKSHIVEDTV